MVPILFINPAPLPSPPTYELYLYIKFGFSTSILAFLVLLKFLQVFTSSVVKKFEAIVTALSSTYLTTVKCNILKTSIFPLSFFSITFGNDIDKPESLFIHIFPGLTIDSCWRFSSKEEDARKLPNKHLAICNHLQLQEVCNLIESWLLFIDLL